MSIRTIFRNITQTQREEFKNLSCLLTISVGQKSQEGDHFATTIDLISKTFRECTITLHDSLQRHTIALDQEQEASHFYEGAVKIGEDWLASNEHVYMNRAINFKVIRWDAWLNDSDFGDYAARIASLIRDDNTYKAAFDTAIEEYLNRFCKRLNTEQFDHERAYRLCLDYLIEECAVLCLWPKTQCHFELYPGKHNAAMQETRKRFIFPKYPNLIIPITIGFTHRSNLLPQRLHNKPLISVTT